MTNELLNEVFSSENHLVNSLRSIKHKKTHSQVIIVFDEIIPN